MSKYIFIYFQTYNQIICHNKNMLEKQQGWLSKDKSYTNITQIPTYISHLIAQNLWKFILQKCSKAIDEKEVFKETLKKFSKTKIIKNIEEVNTLHFLQENKVDKVVNPPGYEPVPLFIDSLLPKSADIDAENSYRQNLKNMMSFNQSQLSQRKRKIQKQIQKILYHKLDLKQQNQDDGFTKQLRKMQEQKVKKMEAEEKAKNDQLNLFSSQTKDKKKQRQVPFSFDYSGSQIMLRSQKKTNLVSKLIQDKLNSNVKIFKQAFNDKNPTVVDSNLVKNKKKNSLPVLKLRQDVKFNQNRSLSQAIDVGGGIKYTYEEKTLQGKSKSLSTIQLKKYMHERMLSRDQFQKVRSLNGSQISLNIYSNINKQTYELSKSQMYQSEKLKKTKEKKEKIVVSNQILKQKLLEKIEDYLEPKSQVPNPEKQRLSLSFTDIFNMNYLKTGGNPKEQIQKRTNKSGKNSSLSLPKIIYTNANGTTMPKQRQKLKETNSIYFQLRKRFQDKLRL